MGDTLDDLCAVLYAAKQGDHERADVGIGKNEIHPLAFHLKRKTDGELFQDTDFRQGYRGVRSPDLRQVLSFFEYNVDRHVIEDGVEEPDEYFTVEYDDDVRRGKQRLESLNEDARGLINDAIDDIIGDRLEFIQNENRVINEETRVIA